MLSEYKKIFYAFLLCIYVMMPIKSEAIGTNKYSVTLKSNNIAQAMLKKWQSELEIRPIPAKVELNYFYYRFEQDRLLLKKMLESEGYYQSIIEADFNEKSLNSSYIINEGEQYKFGRIEIIVKKNSIINNSNESLKAPDLEILKSKTNGKAQTYKVIDDVANIEKWIEKNSCLFRYEVSYDAIVNHNLHQIDIVYHINYANEATYGDITFSGLKSIDERYLTHLLNIKQGGCFKYLSLEIAKLNLRHSNLLDKIEIKLPKYSNIDGSVPVQFIVTERPHKTIKAGINYSTDMGLGLTSRWENRNTLSNGEQLSAQILFTKIQQKLSLELESPFFMIDNQKLKIASSVTKKDNDAYKSKGFDVLGALERSYNNKWTAGAGVKYSFEHAIEQGDENKSTFLSSPLFITQDKRDDIADPQKGWVFNLTSEPAFDVSNVNIAFIKNYISGSYYKSISSSGKSVFALKIGLGSIMGSSSKEIPITERFYGGGGESVRGYAYQLASPLDQENKPIGGKSIFTSSAELRFHLSHDYGIVPFIDCGRSFINKTPDFKGNLLCGAGMGLRYYSLFGPLRADLAVPLNRRKGVDSSFQLYFSIGQSF